MAKRTKTIIISAAVIIILLLLIIPKLNSSDKPEQAGPRPGGAGGPLQVKGYVVKPEKLANNVVTSGSLIANEEVELKSETAGKITRIAFREGSRVAAGTLLVKINDAELQANLKRAKFRMDLLQNTEYRQKQLLNKEAISQEEYEAALNEFNIAKAEVQVIEAQIDQTEIRAPFSGIIGLKNVSEGSYVTPATVIATLQNINPLKIDFSIPEKYAGNVRTGDPIKFTVAGNDREFTGRVYAIEPKIDPVTRTLKIRAMYPNSDGKILPGSFADIRLILKEVENAMLVPTQAIVPELKGQKVFILRNGKAVPQKVETGIRTETRIQLTSGISANDTVITTGILQLRPGVPVKLAGLN